VRTNKLHRTVRQRQRTDAPAGQPKCKSLP